MHGIPSSGSTSQPAQSGVQPIKLPRALSFRAGQSTDAPQNPAGPRNADSVNLRPGLAGAASGISSLEQNLNFAQKSVDELDRVGVLLDDLRGLVNQARTNESGAGLAGIQAKIDKIVETIGQAEQLATVGRQPNQPPLSLGYALFRNESLTTGASGYAKFAPGQEAFGLDVVVTTSAQQAGFLLSFGASELRLGAYSGGSGSPNFFILEVAGNRDVQQFAFASGTSLSDVAAAINSRADSTGVQAHSSGTGLVLNSSEYGSEQFVSVQVLAHGFLQRPPEAGIYQLEAFDSNSASPTGRLRSLTYSPNPLVDQGQDVQATIGGVQATTKGLNIRAGADNWRLNIDLAASFAAGIQAATPIAWFFPDAVEARPNAEETSREAQEFIPGITRRTADLRNVANDRLAAARDQLRASLGGLSGANAQKFHLDTLAELRRSLLGGDAG